jgi:hypothetical protein
MKLDGGFRFVLISLCALDWAMRKKENAAVTLHKKKGARTVSEWEFWTPRRIAQTRRERRPLPPGLTEKRLAEFRRIVRAGLLEARAAE